jgi:hypothetical protein
MRRKRSSSTTAAAVSTPKPPPNPAAPPRRPRLPHVPTAGPASRHLHRDQLVHRAELDPTLLPARPPDSERLTYYATRLRTVEIDSTWHGSRARARLTAGRSRRRTTSSSPPRSRSSSRTRSACSTAGRAPGEHPQPPGGALLRTLLPQVRREADPTPRLLPGRADQAGRGRRPRPALVGG